LEFLKEEAQFDETRDELVFGKRLDDNTVFCVIHSNISIYEALAVMFEAHESWVLEIFINPKKDYDVDQQGAEH